MIAPNVLAYRLHLASAMLVVLVRNLHVNHSLPRSPRTRQPCAHDQRMREAYHALAWVCYHC